MDGYEMLHDMKAKELAKLLESFAEFATASYDNGMAEGMDLKEFLVRAMDVWVANVEE